MYSEASSIARLRTLVLASLGSVVAGMGCGMIGGFDKDYRLATEEGVGGTAGRSREGGGEDGAAGETGGVGGSGGDNGQGTAAGGGLLVIPTTLAYGQHYPRALAIDGRNVYWATEDDDGRGVWKTAKGGGAAVRLAAIGRPATHDHDPRPVQLALDADTVYWIEDNVGRCCETSTPGCMPNRLMKVGKESESEPRPVELLAVCPPSYFAAVAVDFQKLYFAVGNSRTLARWRKGSRAPVNMGNSTYEPTQLAVDSSHVFWIDRSPDGAAGSITRMRIEGGEGQIVFTATEAARIPKAMILDDEGVYWVDQGRVNRLAKAADATTVPEVLAVSDGDITAIAVDDQHVYWTTPHWSNTLEGAILRVSKDGTRDAEVVTARQNFPAALVLDKDDIYWTDYNRGTVMKLPKR